MSEKEGDYHCHAPNPAACPFCNREKAITVGDRTFPECHEFLDRPCFFKVPTKYDLPPAPGGCNCIRRSGDTGTCPIHNADEEEEAIVMSRESANTCPKCGQTDCWLLEGLGYHRQSEEDDKNAAYSRLVCKKCEYKHFNPHGLTNYSVGMRALGQL